MRPTTSDNENDLASSPIRGPASVLGGASGGVTTAGINPGKRRHVSVGGQSCSPGSANGGEEVEGQEEKRKHPVKRACNECRQQKLRCDVIQEPFTTCTRCRRLKLDCKIESNFKRIGKRSRNAEMERELIELRKQIANANAAANAHHFISQHQSPTQASPPPLSMTYGPAMRAVPQNSALFSADEYMRPHEAVASLLDLRSGLDSSNFLRSPSGQVAMQKRIEDVSVSQEKVGDLFGRFFTFYHPFLPFLDRDKLPEDYFSTSPLLFWTIISVGARRYQSDATLLNSLAGPVMRLVWSTLADVPQSYHIVKALALLCTWPFPTSSTSTDPTFMLCGMMMQMALQIGLHRPSHAQDFTKFRVEFREGELKDRITTWAICNIVSQRVATGYGQPPSTLFDWTLSSGETIDSTFRLLPDIKSRLDIEKFSDKVTKALYSSHRDPVGVVNDEERTVMTSVLLRDFEDLETRLHSQQQDPLTNMYLRAAGLHLHLSVFFDDPTTKNYLQGLSSLYVATTVFLEAALGLDHSGGPGLTYSSNYIYQMTLAAGFTLLKLCKSFFAVHIDMDYTKSLFNRTIWALRSMSVSNNDLPERLAEVLAQMWKMGSLPAPQQSSNKGSGQSEKDDTLRLKVRCRMSMSLVYDSVWRWREDFQAQGKNLETYLKNPTNPDSGPDSSSSSVSHLRASTSTPGAVGTADPSLAPAPLPPSTAIGGLPPTGGNLPAVGGLPSGYLEPMYEVFDPLNWILDGLVDFPTSYNSVQGIEAQGAA
ncbi:Zn(II)2Cys6 transcriptional activator [Coccidioides immitis H538.4]|uniref:Zn(II)2Cys6 transcriptional activator n=2 Tax=Coccidioides immitis TaxID=5501 RepID=A0A0J8UN50_COCIT|nr:Zn(II)2Cys6 transcriptional activator [Coccidioides immitis RMSCC 2394]KMU88988.1 Zn(II)2Cys6 transcriptional activator [Coccidioides immitis H538.4]